MRSPTNSAVWMLWNSISIIWKRAKTIWKSALLNCDHATSGKAITGWNGFLCPNEFVLFEAFPVGVWKKQPLRQYRRWIRPFGWICAFPANMTAFAKICE